MDEMTYDALAMLTVHGTNVDFMTKYDVVEDGHASERVADKISSYISTH